MGHLLSIALAGLRRDDPAAPWAAGPRAAIDWAGSLGVGAVQLDGTAPGVRARDLDRSARRDLAAMLRRTEQVLTGVDLWLPGEHLLDPAHIDRAVAAIAGAIGLAAELSPLAGGQGRIVSVMLPARLDPGVRDHLAAEADRHGVRLADHTWPPGPPSPAGGDRQDEAPPESTPAWPHSIAVGLDPAAVALAGDQIGPAAARVADRLATARLCDLSSAGRILPGSSDGRLDLVSYRVGLSLAPRNVPLVADVRGLQDQDESARRMIASWRAADPIA